MVRVELNKNDFVWIGMFLVLLGVGIVYAYGGSSPAVMGYSLGEVERVQWESVSLSSSRNFDVDCEYRFKFPLSLIDDYVGSDPYYYNSAIYPTRLTMTAHSGVVSHINSDSKEFMRVNGVVKYPITLLEERC